jgi:hypothetical protein
MTNPAKGRRKWINRLIRMTILVVLLLYSKRLW